MLQLKMALQLDLEFGLELLLKIIFIKYNKKKI